MRAIAAILFCAGLLTVASLSTAQPPDSPPGKGKGGKGGKGGPGGFGGRGERTATVESMVARMMAFDKNSDGKLTKDEVTDGRLTALFERADANKDGTVTKDELTQLFTKESAALSRGPGGFGGPDGPGGFPGGPGRFGPPPLGQIMPPFVADQLNMTDAQRKQLESLQQDVEKKLDKILTEEQRKQFKEMRERGPGGPGGPGGFRGPGGPGGPGGPPPPPQE